MKYTAEYIEQLLAKFQDGRTSEAEEQLLADFFCQSNDIPAEWDGYRQIFLSFRTDAYDFSDQEIDAMLTPVVEKESWIARLWPYAAAVCIIACTLMGINILSEQEQPSCQITQVDSTGTYLPKLHLQEEKAALSKVKTVLSAAENPIAYAPTPHIVIELKDDAVRQDIIPNGPMAQSTDTTEIRPISMKSVEVVSLIDPNIVQEKFVCRLKESAIQRKEAYKKDVLEDYPDMDEKSLHMPIVQVDGIYYYLQRESQTAIVTHKKDSLGLYTGAVNIPSSISVDSTTYSVTRIGKSAFNFCKELTSVTIPNSVTSIGDLAFNTCTSLNSITIPNSVFRIGELAFWYCTNLTSITLSDGLYIIGHSAFAECKKLSSINIPKTVIIIGTTAFFLCHSIQDVYCYCEEPPTLGYFIFEDSNVANATLHVPENCVEKYRCAEQWNEFLKVVAITDGNERTDSIKQPTKTE